jgi:flagellar protein FlbD
LNGSQLYLNSDLVKWLESSPDTVVTLVTGEKIVVVEPVDEIVRRIEARRRVTPAVATVLATIGHAAAAEHQD